MFIIAVIAPTSCVCRTLKGNAEIWLRTWKWGPPMWTENFQESLGNHWDPTATGSHLVPYPCRRLNPQWVQTLLGNDLPWRYNCWKFLQLVITIKYLSRENQIQRVQHHMLIFLDSSMVAMRRRATPDNANLGKTWRPSTLYLRLPQASQTGRLLSSGVADAQAESRIYWTYTEHKVQAFRVGVISPGREMKHW